MAHLIKPPRLKEGDTVGIISPSNSVVERKESLEKAMDLLEEELGLRVILSAHAMGRHHYTSGTSAQRVQDFHDMVLHPEVKAIFFSVGGNNAIDMVDTLDYTLIKNHPKIISGISDATTLLGAITARAGLITFLGLELTDLGKFDMPYEVEMMRKAWFDGHIGNIRPNSRWQNFDDRPTSYDGWQTIRKGKASGHLVGGNFTSFFQLLHTPYSMSFEKAILLIETYKFKKRGIHQALRKLHLHGVLGEIGGLIVGYCLGSDDPEEYGDRRSMKETVLEATAEYDFPVMWVGEIGHKVENIMIPLGAQARMNATNLTFTIDERVVE